MYTFAYEYPTFLEVIVTDGSEENSFSFSFGKDQDVEVSIVESVRLAELIIASRNPVPIAI